MRTRWVAALAALALPLWAGADEALWSLLNDGGQVVLIRHAATVAGTGDPPGMRLEDCGTQRNLSEAGRAHARRIGEEFRKRKLPVARVLSSQWCRCLETAHLAFGTAEVSASLGNLFGRPENRAQQVRETQALVANWEGAGNLVLVSHATMIYALTGVSPGTGEAVVATPTVGGRLTLAGRLAIE